MQGYTCAYATYTSCSTRHDAYDIHLPRTPHCRGIGQATRPSRWPPPPRTRRRSRRRKETGLRTAVLAQSPLASFPRTPHPQLRPGSRRSCQKLSPQGLPQPAKLQQRRRLQKLAGPNPDRRGNASPSQKTKQRHRLVQTPPRSTLTSTTSSRTTDHMGQKSSAALPGNLPKCRGHVLSESRVSSTRYCQVVQFPSGSRAHNRKHQIEG
jgi:hypothetical protein